MFSNHQSTLLSKLLALAICIGCVIVTKSSSNLLAEMFLITIRKAVVWCKRIKVIYASPHKVIQLHTFSSANWFCAYHCEGMKITRQFWLTGAALFAWDLCSCIYFDHVDIHNLLAAVSWFFMICRAKEWAEWVNILNTFAHSTCHFGKMKHKTINNICGILFSCL